MKFLSQPGHGKVIGQNQEYWGVLNRILRKMIFSNWERKGKKIEHNKNNTFMIWYLQLKILEKVKFLSQDRLGKIIRQNKENWGIFEKNGFPQVGIRGIVKKTGIKVFCLFDYTS